MWKKFAIQIITVLVIYLTPIYANQVKIINEDYIVNLAIKNNPKLLSYNNMKKSAEAIFYKNIWLPDPILSFENMGGEGNLFSAGMKKIGISQKIPFPLKYIFKAGIAASNINYFKYLYEIEKLKVIKDAKIYYYKYYKTKKIIDIMEKNVELIKQFAQIASSRYISGKATQQDVLKAEVEYSKLENELITLKYNLKIIQAKIKYIIGDNNFDFKNVKLKKPEIKEIKLSFDDIKKILNEVPKIKIKKAEKEKYENIRNLNILNYIPDINVSYKKYLDNNGVSNNYDVMVGLSIPLWFLTNTQAEINKSVEIADSKFRQYIDEKNRIIMKAREYYEILMSTKRLVSLYETTLIPQANASYKAALSGYESGKVEFINLLDSERTLLNFEVKYLEAFTNYLIYFSSLEEILNIDLSSSQIGGKK